MRQESFLTGYGALKLYENEHKNWFILNVPIDFKKIRELSKLLNFGWDNEFINSFLKEGRNVIFQLPFYSNYSWKKKDEPIEQPRDNFHTVIEYSDLIKYLREEI